MNKNTLKTIILFSVLTTLLVGVGYMIGGASGFIIAGIFAVLINFGSYWFSSSIALRFARAQEADKNQYSSLYSEVEDLARRMDLPMPKVYISPEMQPNAFATGRGPKDGVVCFTQGILQMLNREELRGVIAHELAHIKNRDVLIATVAATMAGILSAIGDFFMFNLFFGGGDEDQNPLALIPLLIISPIVATVIQLAISRAREFEADKSAVLTTGDKEGMANALLKLHKAGRQIPMQTNSATASLYISNPFGAGGGLRDLFSTHPAMDKRIANIRSVQI